MSKKPTEQRVFADNLREAMTAGRVALKLYLLSTVVEFATSAAIMVLFVISLWATD